MLIFKIWNAKRSIETGQKIEVDNIVGRVYDACGVGKTMCLCIQTEENVFRSLSPEQTERVFAKFGVDKTS